jgi:multiple sugar transport system permease protein
VDLTAPAPARRTHRLADRGAGYGFVAPFLALYLLFLVGPALYNLVASFFDTSLVRPGLRAFVGLRNLTEALRSADFWSSMGHTLWFTVLTTVPLVVLALADRVRRGRWFFRLAFFAPYVLPSAVISLIWMWIYADQVGLAQSMLGAVGIPSPSWLGDPKWVLGSVAIATIWWTLGFNFVLYLAALQDIPREVREAAAIDGAGPWQQITRVVVPLLGRTTTLVVVLQVIASLKVFDQTYIMNSFSDGPGGSGRTAIEYIFDTGFTNYRTGYASAVSLLLFVVIAGISAVWFALARRAEKGV